jgi:hypothetical protein
LPVDHEIGFFLDVDHSSSSSGLRDVHPAELCFPFVDASVADAGLAAQIGDRNAGLMKTPMICSSEKRLRFMLWSSSWARANFNLD